MSNTLRLALAVILAALIGCAMQPTRPGAHGCANGDVVEIQENDGPEKCVCVGGEWQGPPPCDVLNETEA